MARGEISFSRLGGNNALRQEVEKQGHVMDSVVTLCHGASLQAALPWLVSPYPSNHCFQVGVLFNSYLALSFLPIMLLPIDF